MNKKQTYQFEGMMPILPTAVTAEHKIDIVSEKRLVRYCLNFDAKAIGHLAWASEFAKLCIPDRNMITDTLVQEVAGRVPVFIGVTGASRQIATEYAKDAVKYGADILMAAPPYACSPSAQAVYDYYRALSESTNLPIIIQDIFQPRPVLSVDMLWKIYCDFDNVCYIKEEDTDFIYKTAMLLELSGGDINIIGGYGGKHLIHNLEMGIKAFMTGTEALDIHGTVVSLFLSGQTEQAREVYYNKLLPYLVFYEANGEELLKKMLHWRGVIDYDTIIPPSAKPDMTKEELKVFKSVLDRIGFFDFDPKTLG